MNKEIAPRAVVFLRVALAASFLSAVADRVGLWGPAGTGEVAWGNLANFESYTALLLWFLPKPLAVGAAWLATLVEVLLAVGLLIGFRLRLVALAASALLATFALSMRLTTGFEGPFSYSVWTACAAALVLATLVPSYTARLRGKAPGERGSAQYAAAAASAPALLAAEPLHGFP